jgi:5'-deoxynucleotidase YfbR-like HD superfamily hydrolase
MSRESNVINFYVICNRLKYLIRSGWKQWSVQGDRLESVAEHFYSTQMLALAMYSEYNYDLDIKKIIMMLAIHELEETIIGDLVFFEITPEEKERIGHEAISKILEPLASGEKIKELIYEFDAKVTPEAKFAFFCDKLECDLQCKLYDLDDRVDVHTAGAQAKKRNPDVQRMVDEGYSWSDMWLGFSEDRYNYDDNFLSVYRKARTLTKDNLLKNN